MKREAHTSYSHRDPPKFESIVMDNDEGASLTVRRLAADCRIISSPTRLRAEYEIAALFGSIRRECGAEGPSLPSPFPLHPSPKSRGDFALANSHQQTCYNLSRYRDRGAEPGGRSGINGKRGNGNTGERLVKCSLSRRERRYAARDRVNSSSDMSLRVPRK